MYFLVVDYHVDISSVQVNVSDYSNNCWLSCFNETATVLLNCEAQRLGEMRDQVRGRMGGWMGG